ncbi:TonB-dependent siderophore receptor [Roseateles sp.]|uniref:TonB-dependent receptor plug domain-containing protein n=1 Tax=Roseateles sp. TaxID=1971397 RepID=UPI0025D0DEC8|nr:TonB-dependent receptor [Roseateles sp.]MBV8037226.1 TonB-dependent receptor [Roseateles sp.]
MAQAPVAPAAAASAPALQRVEITGSSIRRLEAETALPVTVMTAADMEDRGYSTIADALNSLTVAQNVIPGGNSSGSVMNMRGVGVTRTLTIMNGQRLPYEPTMAAFVNMDLIPRNAIERVEVLRDGASSIYGSDAVGGVVNFITRKQYKGTQLKAQTVQPQMKGGAREVRLSLLTGTGDLVEDGWTIYTSADFQRRTALKASDRPELATLYTLTALGIAPTQSPGDYASPANITKPALGNPYYAKGCNPPFSLPAPQNTCASNNYPNYALLLPENGQASSFTRGAITLGRNNTLSFEAAFTTEYINLSKSTALTSKGKSSGSGGTPVLTITSASPYYPGGSAGVPAMPGVTGQALQLAWQVDELGPATLRNRQNLKRIVITDEGSWDGWDYRVNLLHSTNDEYTAYLTGYIDTPKLYAGVLDGTLNPFGAQTAAGLEYLKSISVTGQKSRISGTRYSAANFTINRDLMELPGGTMAMAFGGDIHYETARDMVPDTNVNVPFDGRTPYDLGSSRRVKSLFAEVDIPVTKTLTLDLSVRSDRYHDVGSTVNPKVSFRYQPVKSLLFRGSYNTGFHAPSLMERYGSTRTGISNTKDNYDDPVLCPGGKPGTAGGGTALPGYSSLVVCNAKQPHIVGANPELAPETSSSVTFGMAVEPIKNFSVTLDFWKIHVKGTIGTLSDGVIFSDPTRYAAFFVRDADKNLLYVNAQSHNLGDTITRGQDIAANWVIPTEALGKFTLGLDGTYTNYYNYQNEPGGEWNHNTGGFGGLANGAVSGDKIMSFRWRHSLRAGWSYGSWRAQVTQAYTSGYHDGKTVPQIYWRDIHPYSVVNLTMGYSGFKNLMLNAGMSNAFNVKPPLTNTTSVGYLRSYASPIGRSFSLTATYKFGG